jgi:restriction system protein
MPHRRHNVLFELNTLVPWWVCVLCASAVFLTFNYLLPENSRLFIWQNNASGFLASPFLLLGIVSFSKQRYRTQLLERESNLKALRKMPWRDFEMLVGEALRRDGFYVDEKGSSGPSSGVDLALWKNEQMIIVQCKRWDMKKIDVDAVKQLYNCMPTEKADACLFVTSGEYTPAAKDFAKGKPIALADGKALLELVQSVQTDKSYEVSKYLKRASLDSSQNPFY